MPLLTATTKNAANCFQIILYGRSPSTGATNRRCSLQLIWLVIFVPLVSRPPHLSTPRLSRMGSQYREAVPFLSTEIEAAFAAEEHPLAGADARLAPLGACHLAHQYHSDLNRSRYGRQLDRYQSWVPPSQLLLLRTEVLFGNPQWEWEWIHTPRGCAGASAIS